MAHSWKDEGSEKEVFGGGHDEIKRLSMVEKTYTIRIVGNYKFFRQHWITKVNRSVICDGVNCPICTAGSKGGLRYVVNILDRADGTLKLYEFGRRVKKAIEAIADLYGDPTKYDLIITRKGMKMEDTTYTVIPAREETPLTEAEVALPKYDLEKLYVITPKEKVEAFLRGETTVAKGKDAEETVEADDLPTL